MSRPNRHSPAALPARHRTAVRKVGRSPFPTQLSLRSKVLDVCLVAVWGATIPGLLWLGSMGGF
ncbi:hypothetical protein [Alcaligenes sp. SDU_A2]|uniref:hypothetical protein n=1 Tax=Alcaligenes sp. SDU_A2 TaxID=3136634 RepID=UPI002BACF327|nr:hypothetical protein [Alcaligenes sp.]HRL27108.1 hypothetical protein [Alcaligenes sp.]